MTTANVFTAWNAVMRDVQAISKDSRNQQQGFNFRGIDAVLNTVGPALREHGVTVVPTMLEHEAERYETQRGGKMVNRVVKMQFDVYGPQGDSFSGIAAGEAADSGDKALSKAQSVALRTFLLQSLTIPTDDPDPDAESHERAGGKHEAKPAKTTSKKPEPADPEAAKALDDLRAVCAEQGWPATKVAAAFKVRTAGKDLRTASTDDITAFTNLALAGTITF